MDNMSSTVSQMDINACVVSGSTAPTHPKRQISLTRKRHNRIRRKANKLKLASTRSNSLIVIEQRQASTNDGVTPVTPRDITIGHSTSVATCKSYPWADNMKSMVSSKVSPMGSPTVSQMDHAADVVSRIPSNTPTPMMGPLPLMGQDHQPKRPISLTHMKRNEKRKQGNRVEKFASFGSHEEIVEQQRTLCDSRVIPDSTDDVNLDNSVSAATWKSYRCTGNMSSSVPPTMSTSRSQMDPDTKIISRSPVPSLTPMMSLRPIRGQHHEPKRSISLSCKKYNQKWEETDVMKTSNLTVCCDKEEVNQKHSSSIERKSPESTVGVTISHTSSVVTQKLHPGTENTSQTVPKKVSTTVLQMDTDSSVAFQAPVQSAAICRLPFTGQEQQPKRRVTLSRQKHNKRRSQIYKLRQLACLTPVMSLLPIRGQPHQPKRSISLSCEKQNQMRERVDVTRTLTLNESHGREEVNQQHTSSINRMSPESNNEVTVGHSDSVVTWKIYPWTKFTSPTVEPEVSTTLLQMDPEANVTIPAPFPTTALSQLPSLEQEHQPKQTISLPYKKHNQNQREAYRVKNLAYIRRNDRVDVDQKQNLSTKEFSLESSNDDLLGHSACMAPCKSSPITENMSATVSPSVMSTMHPTKWPPVLGMISQTVSQIDPNAQVVSPSPAPTPTTLMSRLPFTGQEHMAKRTISLSRKKRNRRRRKANIMKKLTTMKSKEVVEGDKQHTLSIDRKNLETPVQVTKGHSPCVATSESYPWTEHMSPKFPEMVSQMDPHTHVIMRSPASILTPMIGLNSFVGQQHQPKESISVSCKEHYQERGRADVMSNVTSMGSRDGVVIKNKQTLWNDRVTLVPHKDVNSGHSPSIVTCKSYQETENMLSTMWPPALPIVSPTVWQINPDAHVVSPSPGSSVIPMMSPIPLTGQDHQLKRSICLSPKGPNKQQRQTDNDKKLIWTVSKERVEVDQQHTLIINRMSPKPPDEIAIGHSTSVATCKSDKQTENVSPTIWPPVFPVASPAELQMDPEAHVVSRSPPPTLTTSKSHRPSMRKGQPSKRPVSLGRKKHNQKRKQTNRAKKIKMMKIKGGVIVDEHHTSNIDRIKPKSPNEVTLGNLALVATSKSYPRTDNMLPKVTATVRSTALPTVSLLDTQTHVIAGIPAHIPTPMTSLTSFLGQHHPPKRSINLSCKEHQERREDAVVGKLASMGTHDGVVIEQQHSSIIDRISPKLSDHITLGHSSSVATCQSNLWIESVLEIVSQMDID